MEKTSQALREGQPKLRQQMVELGGVAGVTAGGGTTTTSTASGVATLQHGTGTTSTTAATGASFQMYFYLYFGVQQSPLLPPTPGSSYCFFLASRDFDYLVTPTNKQQQQTICISLKMMCIYMMKSTPQQHDLIIGYTTT